MLQQMFLFKNLKHRVNRRTHKRISSVCRSVISREQRSLCDLLRHRKCPYRHTVSNRLCHRHNIWFDSVSLPCKHRSGSSHTALNLIKDKQNILLVAKRSKPFQKRGFRRVDPAFPLHCLQNNRTGLVRQKCFHTFQIIIIGKFYTFHQRFKWFSILFCTCHGKRPHTSSMKGMVHRNKLIPATLFRISILSGSFQRPFNRLCSAVCKKYTIHARHLS